jgi:hypothetical protein
MIAPMNLNKPKFELGQIVATPGALAALGQSNESAATFIRQHHNGVWGDICEEDLAANERALIDGERILSVYHTSKGEKLYVITEADRSSTCILLPEEY